MCCCNNVQKSISPWSRTYFLFMSHFLIISIIILCRSRNTRKHIFHEWTHKVYNKTKNNNKENAKKWWACQNVSWLEVNRGQDNYFVCFNGKISYLFSLLPQVFKQSNVRLDFSQKMMIKNYYQRKLKEFFLLF